MNTASCWASVQSKGSPGLENGSCNLQQINHKKHRSPKTSICSEFLEHIDQGQCLTSKPQLAERPGALAWSAPLGCSRPGACKLRTEKKQKKRNKLLTDGTAGLRSKHCSNRVRTAPKCLTLAALLLLPLENPTRSERTQQAAPPLDTNREKSDPKIERNQTKTP